jgi:hypothetical protein
MEFRVNFPGISPESFSIFFILPAHRFTTLHLMKHGREKMLAPATAKRRKTIRTLQKQGLNSTIK